MAKKEATKKETTKKKTAKKTVKKIKEQTPTEANEIIEEVSSPAVAETDDANPMNVEPVNGDPSVLAPINEANPPVEEQEEITEKEESVEEIKEPKNVFKRIFGYIWNGQEMDY